MSSPAPLQPGPWRTAVTWGATGLSMLGLYFAFTANAGWREIIAGVISSGVVTAGAVVFARQAGINYHLRARDLAQIWRMPWYAFTGTWEVLQGLGRQLFTKAGAPSFLATTPFDIGAPLDPAEAGRRALAVFDTTLTPNFVIIGIFPEQRLLMYHQILPGEVITMTRKLGARP